MNVADVEVLGNTLKESADKLVQLSAVLEKLVAKAGWQGAAATQFKREWWPGHRGRLGQLSKDLYGFGQSALNNAAAQRTASSAHGGAVVGQLGPASRVTTSFPDGVENQRSRGAQSRVVTFGQFFDRQEQLGQDQFEILRVSENPPRYIVNLPGVEFNGWDPWEQDHLRDLRGASAARLAGVDAYAERVKLEMQRAGVPVGAEVMLVGHSAGAIAAMNMARDQSFNQPGNVSASDGYHVQVTHVMAAGAGLADWVDDPPVGTDVLMVINRNDVVAAGIQVGDFGVPRVAHNGLGAVVNDVFDITDARSRSVSDGRVVMEFSSNAGMDGHHYNNYERGLATADQPANLWMDEAAYKYFTGGGTMQTVTVSLPDNIRYGNAGDT